MCLGTIGRVICINGREATLDVDGVEVNVELGLLSDIEIGDLVMVHAGCAIQKMDQDEADEFNQLAEEITSVMRNRCEDRND
ncbi:MAG: HypC/HybG/HupF family hydrogenase formation chaperone [Clostridia bacterium]